MSISQTNIKISLYPNPEPIFKPIILCDFDGTISLEDVTDTLLMNFAKEGWGDLEEQWVRGQIGSRECMSKQIALLDADPAELDQVLDSIEIDPHFVHFVNTAKHKMAIHIVSDGLDYAIRRILTRIGLDWLPVIANQLVYDNNRKWHINFPYANPICLTASGNCKCQYVNQCRSHYSSVMYVGDGASDYCVSHQVDLVFAKNKLIDYCRTHHINYYLITNFADVLNIMTNRQDAYFFSRNPRNSGNHDH